MGVTSDAWAYTWGKDRIDSRDGTDGTYTPARGSDGEGAVIYVLDTGIRISNDDFEGRAEAGWSAGCGLMPSTCELGWAFRGVIDDKNINKQTTSDYNDSPYNI